LAHLEAQGDTWTPAVAIYLTDGYGRFPERAPDVPMLWVITPGGLALEKVPFGEAVRLVR
jgi:predicted metal-dependent peptidase